jgi:hypothetical protein
MADVMMRDTRGIFAQKGGTNSRKVSVSKRFGPRLRQPSKSNAFVATPP